MQKMWPNTFGGEVISIACHIINQVYLRPCTNKSPYKLWKGKHPTIKYFKLFGSKCFILRDKENLVKFYTLSDEGIFLGYSLISRAYCVYNLRT